jgi:hypothetical protein
MSIWQQFSQTGIIPWKTRVEDTPISIILQSGATTAWAIALTRAIGYQTSYGNDYEDEQ